MDILAPNTLVQNRYLIIQLLGKGETGEVYLAVDQRLGNAVVLKKIAFSGSENDTEYEHQAETLTRLRHPVLPKVETTFTEDRNLYLVAEHIQGDDLAQRIKLSAQPFPANWVLFWGDQLLDALAYLHSHEPAIIHGNIKPQNLKLNEENNIFLLDVGMFGRKAGIEEGSVSTEDKLNYASREQLRGMASDARSDIYSLSATLYTLLTGVVPPDAVKRADTVLSSLPDPLKPVNEVNGEVSRTISDAIMKGMSLNADARYQTAREMQKTLRDVYAGMQETMTAQTVAFNVADVQAAVTQPQTVPVESNILGDEYYGHSVPVASIPGAVTLPVTQISSEIASNGTSYSESAFQNKVSDPNYEAVVPSAAPLTDSDVFAADAEENFSAVPSNNPSNYPPASSKIEAYDVSQNIFYENQSSQPENTGLESSDFDANIKTEDSGEEVYTAQATVPLVSFDNKFDEVLKQSSADVPKELPVENTAVNLSAEPDFTIQETPIQDKSFAAPVAVNPVGKAAVAPPVVKKSNNKVFAIAGAGLAVVVLGTLAAAAGLYALNPSGIFGSANTEPVSTSTPKTDVITEATPPPPAVEPSVEATPETVFSDSNSNTDAASISDSANTSDQSNKNTTAPVVSRQSEEPAAKERNNPVVKTQPEAPQKIEPTVVERPQQRSATTASTSAKPERTPKLPKTAATPVKKATPKGPETL